MPNGAGILPVGVTAPGRTRKDANNPAVPSEQGSLLEARNRRRIGGGTSRPTGFRRACSVQHGTGPGRAPQSLLSQGRGHRTQATLGWSRSSPVTWSWWALSEPLVPCLEGFCCHKKGSND